MSYKQIIPLTTGEKETFYILPFDIIQLSTGVFERYAGTNSLNEEIVFDTNHPGAEVVIDFLNEDTILILESRNFESTRTINKDDIIAVYRKEDVFSYDNFKEKLEAIGSKIQGTGAELAALNPFKKDKDNAKSKDSQPKPSLSTTNSTGNDSSPVSVEPPKQVSYNTIQEDTSYDYYLVPAILVDEVLTVLKALQKVNTKALGIDVNKTLRVLENLNHTDG